MSTASKEQNKYQWGVWVWVKWKPGAPENAWDQWKGADGVEAAWSTTGEWDCALWLDLQSPDAVENFVWKEIRSNQWVEKTDTSWAKKWC